MTRYGSALSISVLFHLFLIAGILIITISKPAVNRGVRVRVDLLRQVENREALKPPPVTQRPRQETIRPTEEKVPTPPIAEPPDRHTELETVSALATLQKQPTLHHALIKQTPFRLNRDSLLHVQADNWKQAISELALKPAEDPGADYLKKVNGEPDFNKMGIAQVNEPKREIPQFNFIPTEDQARAMAYLFKHKHGTQLDMYPAMKTQKPITAVRFDRSMKKLTEKGFVYREKISPENLFVVATPVVAVPIEMSAKNRKNPVFNYTLNVERKKVLAYLDSRLLKYTEILKKFPVDSTRTKSRINIIQSRIDIIRQGAF